MNGEDHPKVFADSAVTRSLDKRLGLIARDESHFDDGTRKAGLLELPAA